MSLPTIIGFIIFIRVGKMCICGIILSIDVVIVTIVGVYMVVDNHFYYGLVPKMLQVLVYYPLQIN